jgi:muramidase (phage lysozyme)
MEGTKKPLIRLLLLFNKHKRYHLLIQTHSEMSRFPTEACPTQWLLVPKPPENLTFSNDTLILMKITDSRVVKMLIRIRHLKQVVSHLNQTWTFLPWQSGTKASGFPVC